ncbi:MAG TPA: FHA domain-containing protein [Candidatus Nanoarchaeia archaeon]|nr:FHA domain-containing protein [Candidatus Nanoarchaeia archaeon]
MFGFGTKAELVFGSPIKPIKLTAKTIEIGRSEQAISLGKVGDKSLFYQFDGRKLLFKDNYYTHSISRNHCHLTWDNKSKRYLLTDYSRKGTWINGIKVGRVVNSTLENGDHVAIGSKDLKFEILYPRRFLF